MKNKITANLGLKIGSILFATILWLLVTNISDPVLPYKFYDIPVKLTNTELITGTGQVYQVLENTDVIDTVTVMAPRTVGETLSSSNIIATADMSELSSLDTLSIHLSTSVYNSRLESITGNIDSVKLNIETKKTKTLALTATTSGAVESGYLIGDVTTEQNLVRISGPESLVSSVAKAVVDVDVTGFTSDIGTDAEIRLYDAEDKLINDDNLVQNISVVRVNVSILQTKTVPINFNISGTCAPGYQPTGAVEATVDSVLIAGKSSALKNVAAIEIPEEVLDISGQSENFVTTLNIREYLPDNVSLGDSRFGGNVDVTVLIEAETSKKLEIRSDKVTITNMPEGFTGSISGLEETFTLETIGLNADISTLRAADVTGTVDVAKMMEEKEMTEMVEGYYTVEVDFNLADSITLLEPISVTLHISEKEAETE